VALAAAVAGILTAAPATAGPVITEVRDPCSDYSDLRQPYFGDLHIHTTYSADAYIYGNRGSPADAYAFARGAEITLSDDNEEQTRTATIDRPLDFAAVTDHSEFFGEVDLCTTPGSIVYDDPLCEVLRLPEPDLSDRFQATLQWLFPLGLPNPPTEQPFCGRVGVDCDASAASAWQEIQAAAEAAYDRTSACTFTTFAGYEYTASPIGRHLHRNVVFRNENVPSIALSHLDTYDGGTPQGLWSAIESQCLQAGTGCDAVIIPHNPNLSDGAQFFDPADATEAARRQALEPLVEMHQVKGNSECRFDQLAGAGVDTEDELCTFEQEPLAHQSPDAVLEPVNEYPRRNMVRNVLKDGLYFEETLGSNPFQMGLIGSTDTHNANPGDTEETTWPGASGNNDSSAARQIGRSIRDNPGGVAVAWAEENARDAIFEAFRRRETYATSGTRPVVRFFGGDLTGVGCGNVDFVEQAYATGVPMGGTLGTTCGADVPRFAVWAIKDPGTLAIPGTDLQRVQIIKGWLDADGVTHEEVFDVAGDAMNGAGVDPSDCSTTGIGDAELCTVWEDPTFVPSQRAFYYVRVLENPTCRWSTHVCMANAVNPFDADCDAQAALAGSDFADCCLGEDDDEFLSPVVQERAWTSPIWYQPERLPRIQGKLRFDDTGTNGALNIRARLDGSVTLDPAAQDFRLNVSDDAVIFSLDVPAGTLAETMPGRWTYDSASGSLPGVAVLKILANGRGVPRVLLKTGTIDLTGVDGTDHIVQVQIEHGGYCPAVGHRWVRRGPSLRIPRNR
jgi:hypothetical protein